MLTCNCNFGKSQMMFFKPNEIFNAECYRKLITESTSDSRINLAQIKRSARNRIDKDEGNILKIPITNIDNDEFTAGSAYPPVEVDPICTNKITINLKVSKATDDNNKDAV